MKKLFIAGLLFFVFANVSGGNRNRCYEGSPHSIGFIVSDAVWEQVMYHDIAGLDYSGCNPTYTYTEKNNYWHSPHVALEYAYRMNNWFELAMQTDFQLTTWDVNEYRGGNASSHRNCFYNLSFIPEARFVYLRRKYVEMHSGLGIGMNINGGSEVFPGEGHSVNTLAYDINYVGVKAGAGHWYGTFDLGGTFAFFDTSTFFMVSARIFRLGVCYKF